MSLQQRTLLHLRYILSGLKYFGKDKHFGRDNHSTLLEPSCSLRYTQFYLLTFGLYDYFTTEAMFTVKTKTSLHHSLIFLPTVLDLFSLSNSTFLFLTLFFRSVSCVSFYMACLLFWQKSLLCESLGVFNVLRCLSFHWALS